MASNEQLTQSLRNLLDEGVRAGVLTRAQADQRLRDAGVQVDTPARTITITTQVRGDLGVVNGYAQDQVRRQVEQALAGVARQAGLTVAPGTTRVTV